LDSNNRPTNIITQSRIIRFAGSCLAMLPILRKTILELGIAHKTVISVTEKDIVADAFMTMIESHVSAVGIVNKKGILLGTISETDVRMVGHKWKFLQALNLKCGEFLEQIKSLNPHHPGGPISVNENATMEYVLKLINFYSVHRVFVVDDDGFAVGVVSTSDIIDKILTTQEPPSEKELKKKGNNSHH